MKACITALLCLSLLLASSQWPSAPARAQLAPVALVLVVGAGACGLLIWAYAKNETILQMRWLVLERGQQKVSGPWTPVATNRVPVGPKVMEAFPAFIVVTNGGDQRVWFRVRLAEDDEIPQGFTPQITPGKSVQPVLYNPAALSALFQSP